MPDDTATASSARRVVHAACPHDCPDTCAMLITVEDGRAVKVQGDPTHPTTHGTLCTKVARYLERTYSDQRVLHPLRRVGKKGEGKFARITWDEALDTIAARFKQIVAESGGEAILPYSYAGTMGWVQGNSMDFRFFHRLGASQLKRTICSAAGTAGITATLGGKLGMDMEQFENAKLILIWGANPIVSNLHLWTRCQEAKRRGAKLIAIDPYRSQTAEKCHEHLALMPGTDGALALGLMHVLIAENLLDHDYIERHTLGFEQLKQRVADYPPERVARLTGLAAAQIVALARDYGRIKPAAVRLNYGLQRCAGGGMAVRNIACLPALVGAWRDPAGGCLLSSSGTFPIDHRALQRPDLMARPTRAINMSTIGDALHETRDPPIRALFVYDSNPLAVAPDTNKVIAGFAREDLFCVVHEIFQTDTADYADIVLPATTQLEQTDVHTAYGHLYVLANNPAIAPLGEAKPNAEVFRLLAARMGFDEPCFSESDEDIARQALRKDDTRAANVDWQALKQQGWQRLNLPRVYAPFADGGFPTASGKCEFYSQSLAQRGHDPLPTYVPPRESPLTDAQRAQRYPLAIISPPARNFLNTSFSHLPSFRSEEREPHLDIHPRDAEARRIVDGDWVRVFNDRGSFTARARVSERTRVDVVVAPSIWWLKHAPGGANANAVVSQAVTDMGEGPTFYDCLVQVERAA